MAASSCELPPGDLKLLDKIGGSGEEHAPAVLDQREADGRGKVALSATGRAEQDQELAPFCEPAIAGGRSP